ncbi:MAG: hypothetical protein WAM40_18180 [Xanthobacteraceae bacterium]
MHFLPCYEGFAFGKANAVANADKKSDEKQRGERAGGGKKYDAEPAVRRKNIARSEVDDRNEREPKGGDHKNVKQNRRL